MSTRSWRLRMMKAGVDPIKSDNDNGVLQSSAQHEGWTASCPTQTAQHEIVYLFPDHLHESQR